MNNDRIDISSERGSAGVKFIIFLAVVILVGNAGYNYIPVRYQAESMQTEMATAVLQGLAMPGRINPIDNVKARVQRAAQANDIPPDALITVTQAGNAIQARVTYEKDVALLPFGMYKYHFKFDHTATPTGFLLKQ
jgi:hypothetical protein